MAEDAKTVAPAITPDLAATPASTDPKLFAGKYKSVEDLEKGYVELQGKLGQPSPATPEATPSTPAPAEPAKSLHVEPPPAVPTPNETKPMDIGDILNKAGVNQEDLVASWNETGKLTEDQYKKIERVGYSRQITNGYIGGLAIQGAKMVEDAVKIVGGTDQYNNLLDWAGSNLNAAQRDNLNARLGSPVHSQGAVMELIGLHNMAIGGQGVGGNQGMIDGTPMNTSAPAPTGIKEMHALSKLAQAGDAAAIAKLAKINDAQLTALL